MGSDKKIDITEIDAKIQTLEDQMSSADFWTDKHRAHVVIKEIADLKAAKEGRGKYDRGNAIMTIFSGAGGDDAEDFSSMLFSMYMKFVSGRGWGMKVLHENKNDHGGYRNLTVEIDGMNAYGTLKNESGVHRLVRISPFNSKQQRHTSFSLVEVIPKFEKVTEIEIPEKELRIEFAKAGGPGGQNVNKRETAVRIIHIPTNISVHVSGERSQAQNRDKAMQILSGKIFKALEDARIKKEEGMYISKTTSIEWGNQIRSYVLHPYQMVKDHRTEVETSNVQAVLDGGIELFIDAERGI